MPSRTVLDSILAVWKGKILNGLPPISVMGHTTQIPHPPQLTLNTACSKRMQCERPNNPPWLKSTRRNNMHKEPMKTPHVDRKRTKNASPLKKCVASVKSMRSVESPSKWQRISSGDNDKKLRCKLPKLNAGRRRIGCARWRSCSNSNSKRRLLRKGRRGTTRRTFSVGRRKIGSVR